jgi:hypothetical protein
MQPIRLSITGVVLFLTILLCGTIFLGSGNASASTSVLSPTPVPTANVSVPRTKAITDPPGASAITPSIQQKSVSTVGTTPSPTYTANDVRQYINTYGFVGGDLWCREPLLQSRPSNLSPRVRPASCWEERTLAAIVRN